MKLEETVSEITDIVPECRFAEVAHQLLRRTVPCSSLGGAVSPTTYAERSFTRPGDDAAREVAWLFRADSAMSC